MFLAPTAMPYDPSSRIRSNITSARKLIVKDTARNTRDDTLDGEQTINLDELKSNKGVQTAL